MQAAKDSAILRLRFVCSPQTFATKFPIPFPRGKSMINLAR